MRILFKFLAIVALLLSSLFPAQAITVADTPSPSPTFLFNSTTTHYRQSEGRPGGHVLRSRVVIPNFSILNDQDQGKENLQKAVWLNFFDDAVFLAIPDQVKTIDRTVITWIGHIQGFEDSSVTISVFNDAMTVIAQFGDQLYTLEPDAQLGHIARQLQVSDPYPEMEPLPIAIQDGNKLPELPAAVDADDGSIIQVLVAFTPATRNRWGLNGILSRINTAIAEANQAFTRSQINTQLRLVHIVEVNYGESGDMGLDLSRIAGKADGYMDEIHGVRDLYKADMVSLMIESSQYCGIAYQMLSLSNAFEVYAFSVVSTDCAVGNYSFAHELAHNMGAAHDRNNAGGTPIYPYAYGYWIPNGSGGYLGRTIMAYNCPISCPRIQNFSNPNVLYNGVPTGISYQVNPSQAADNARTINENKLTVSNWRVSGNLPGALNKSSPSNNATNQSTNNLTISWNTSSGASSYEYCIDTSLNNTCNTSWVNVGNNTSATLNGLASNTTYSWQIRAINSSGATDANSSVWWSFVTSTPLPDTFNKTSPVDNAINQMTIVTLMWNNSNNASEYRYCIDATNNDSCDNNWISTGSNTSVLLNNLLHDTQYYWQVRAINNNGSTDSSGGWWRFTTMKQIDARYVYLPVIQKNLSVVTNPLINGNFDSGRGIGWQEYSSNNWFLVMNQSQGLPITPRSGAYAAWLGGGANELARIWQTVTVPGNASTLTFWYQISSQETTCGFDTGWVKVNSTIVGTFNLCNGGATPEWTWRSINLSSYIGQNVTLEFGVQTNGANTSNLFLDDIAFAVP